MQGAGGIISGALSLVKEKERQADKGLERIHDSLKTQTQTTAAQGSWTGKGSEAASAPKEVVIKSTSGNGSAKGDKGGARSATLNSNAESVSYRTSEDTGGDDKEKDETSGLDIFRVAEMVK